MSRKLYVEDQKWIGLDKVEVFVVDDDRYTLEVVDYVRDNNFQFFATHVSVHGTNFTVLFDAGNEEKEERAYIMEALETSSKNTFNNGKGKVYKVTALPAGGRHWQKIKG